MARIIKSFSTSQEMAELIDEAARTEGVSMSQVINRALQQWQQTKVQRDAWGTTDGQEWYDPRKFFTATEDRNGHSAQIRTWVPKNLAGQVARIVNSGMIPELRSSADFFRDAIFHRSKQVARWLDDGELLNEVDLHMMLADELAIVQKQRDVDALVLAMKTNLSQAMSRGDWEWLEGYVDDREVKGAGIPHQLRGPYDDLLSEYKKELRRAKRDGRARTKGDNGGELRSVN